MKGRAAFVCATDVRIGHALADALARRGARVALALPVEDVLAPGRGPGLDGVELLSMDVGQPASVQDAVEAARAECGAIEILVNCLSTPVERPFLETGYAEWRAVVQVALMGVFRVTQAVLPEMIARSAGRVVNVAPDSGRIGGAGQAIDSGCGGGVIAFTKTIARELARHSITVNTVCYGPTENRSTDPADGRGAEARLRAIPLRRLGTPTELAAAVAFLASEEAGFVTGQTLSVNGGTSMV
jgi:2-hydroxycyclohexanecarboxyl-CoA dehydrogenase